MSDQGGDWIWESDWADDWRPRRLKPIELSPLPICCNCSSEVKPGEDECWTCLGEAIPPFTEEYYVYGANNFVASGVYSPTATLPLTIQIPTTSITWVANSPVAVTGLKVGIQDFTFAPINCNSGDSIQFTINGTLV